MQIIQSGESRVMKCSLDKPGTPHSLDIEQQLIFSSQDYSFPNSPVSLPHLTTHITHAPLTQDLIQKLSVLNANPYLIELRHIKQEHFMSSGQQKQDQECRYMLKYETVAYSMEYALQNDIKRPAHSSLRVALKEITEFLIQHQVNADIRMDNFGVDELGHLKIYIPPLVALAASTMKESQKNAIKKSINKIWHIWNEKNSALYDSSPAAKANIRPYRSPQHYRHSPSHYQEQNDVKKTIKLTRDVLNKIKEKHHKDSVDMKGSNVLKKHRSLEMFASMQAGDAIKKSTQFMNKIGQINKKIENIRDNYLQRMEDRESSRRKTRQEFSRNKKEIHESKENKGLKNSKRSKVERVQSQPKKQIAPPILRQDSSSVDTYEEELGEDHEMPKIRTSDKFRQTLEGNESRPVLDPAIRKGWQLCSAGSKQLQGMAMKVMKEHPQLLEKQVKPKPKAKEQDQTRRESMIDDTPRMHPNRLRKMASFDVNGRRPDLSSLEYSDFGREMSVDGSRRDKMRERVRSMVLKSKQAIELLKHPKKTPIVQ